MTNFFANVGRWNPAAEAVERRNRLNAAAKQARRRFFAAPKALDAALRAATAAVDGVPVEEWGAALDRYEAALAPYLDAADKLPILAEEKP